MSYHQLGQQFMAYLIDSINLNWYNLLPVIKQYTLLSINGFEGCGPDQFMHLLYQCQFSDLKMEANDVFCQPIYWKNVYRLEYDGLLISASGNINIVEGHTVMRRNIYFNLVLENINGGYYINNMIIRLSAKGKQVNTINNNLPALATLYNQSIQQVNPYQQINPYYYSYPYL